MAFYSSRTCFLRANLFLNSVTSSETELVASIALMNSAREGTFSMPFDLSGVRSLLRPPVVMVSANPPIVSVNYMYPPFFILFSILHSILHSPFYPPLYILSSIFSLFSFGQDFRGRVGASRLKWSALRICRYVALQRPVGCNKKLGWLCGLLLRLEGR